MINSQNRGESSFDLVMPTFTKNCSNPTMQPDLDPVWTNLKTFGNTVASSESIDGDSSYPKITHSTRPKVEILRANSPTLKRLLNVRIKLEKYLGTLQSDFSSKWSSDDNLDDPAPQPVVLPEPSTTNTRPVRSQKLKSTQKPYSGQAPLDKVTYEKTTAQNGNVKKKCSLEIWLPKADTDDDDETQVMSRLVSAKTNGTGNKSMTNTVATGITNRSNAVKIVTSLIKASTNEKSTNEKNTKQENTIKPRIFRYGKGKAELSEDRPRSGKSGNTIRSEGEIPVKNHQKMKPMHRSSRHLSGSMDRNTEEKQASFIPGVPMSAKNLIENIRMKTGVFDTNSVSSDHNQSPMISELMKKYSMMKKNHQELTQTKLQLEKPYHEQIASPRMSRDNTFHGQNLQENATALIEHPSMSVKKLSIDASPPRSAADHSHGSARILERRTSSKKTNQTEVSPQTRLVALVNHVQTRYNPEMMNGLQRSKTIHLQTETSINTLNNITTMTTTLPIKMESRDILPNNVNRTQSLSKPHEFSSSATSKRSVPAPLLALRNDPQRQAAQPILHLVQYHNVQNSAKRYREPSHLSSVTINSATNGSSRSKNLTHLKFSNGGQSERNCLVPE